MNSSNESCDSWHIGPISVEKASSSARLSFCSVCVCAVRWQGSLRLAAPLRAGGDEEKQEYKTRFTTWGLCQRRRVLVVARLCRSLLKKASFTNLLLYLRCAVDLALCGSI